MDIIVINGPNLNMIGTREPDIYGKGSYKELVRFIEESAESIDMGVEVFQSNSEGAIIERIHESRHLDGIIINAGGYTHTSVAIRDALLSVGLPIIEVHISNIFAREDFRTVSYISDIALGVISGFGFVGYRLALLAIKNHLSTS